MFPLFALTDLLTGDLQEVMKLSFSVFSLGVTVYFWFVRVNRERPNLGVYHAGGFEGALEPGGVGVWSGRLFLANRSILPTAVVAVKAELWWGNTWLEGNCLAGDGSELPWNLPPTQVFAKNVTVAFDLGLETSRAQVYENQRLRLTFMTVEGNRLREEIQTTPKSVALAA